MLAYTNFMKMFCIFYPVSCSSTVAISANANFLVLLFIQIKWKPQGLSHCLCARRLFLENIDCLCQSLHSVRCQHWHSIFFAHILQLVLHSVGFFKHCGMCVRKENKQLLRRRKEVIPAKKTLSPRKKKSDFVWKYFGFRNNDVDQKQVICVTTNPQPTTHLWVLYEECVSGCVNTQKYLSSWFCSSLHFIRFMCKHSEKYSATVHLYVLSFL